MGNKEFSELAERLRFCRAKLVQRQSEISFLDGQEITLAGFGNKGRPLAMHLRDIVGKRVTVFDTTAQGQRAAVEAGFEIYVTREQVNEKHPVVLSACQHQLAQADQFPDNYVFHEEAGYFFNVPFVFNRSQDFSTWILDNWDDVIPFVGGLQKPARDALESVLRFRLSLDPHELSGARRPVSGMWFDIPSEFKRRPYGCFLDVGAFDGDTLEAAADWELGFSKAVAIEANPEFRPRILERGNLYTDGIEVVPCAAWSKSCRLSSTEDYSGMVTVSESETGEISAERLDDVVTTSVDFMKIDIEGAESSALAGAQRILADGLDIAVAAYHRPQDILTIYQTMSNSLKSFDSYRLHVGHYSECLDDTILYFLAEAER